MSRNLRIFFAFLALSAAIFVIWRWRAGNETADSVLSPGGRLTVSLRSEPGTFNRLVSPAFATEVVTRLTQATLARLNRVTGELEPRLAREWQTSEDGLSWTLRLVEGATFSDGEPFSSADVAFTFAALYDERVQSELAASLRVDGQPITVETPGPYTVIVRLPAPYGPGLTLLDALPILPRHKLQAALDSGNFRDAWNVRTSPTELAGLGPFILTRYEPGERLVFSRNPRFWVLDEAGRSLPYLDELEIQVVTDQNTEMLRLESGDVDLTTDEIRAEDYAAMRRLEDLGRVQLSSAGPSISPHALWFNLRPSMTTDREWLHAEAFRRAVSYAVDRQALVDTVFLGAAVPIFGPITPGHGIWYVEDLPRTPYDPDTARNLLRSVGLSDTNGDGQLEDADGSPARFTILTARGSSTRDRAVAVIQEHLRRVGLDVDIAALDVPAMIERYMSGDFEAMYFYVAPDSFDPARNLDFWLSSGGFHFWNPGQPSPATEWEARIDDLMQRQATTMDTGERRQLFAEVQRILADHLPILYFAAPEVTYAVSARVRGAMPSVLQPAILWNAERLAVAAGATSDR